jgi:hypothetical protein
MTGQATFSPEEDDEDEDEDEDLDEDLDGVLTVSLDFFAAGLPSDPLLPDVLLDSFDSFDSFEAGAEESESPDGLSLVPASAGSTPFFLLSVW